MTLSSVCSLEACFSPSRFTGKERDAESGNDYFGARYYASTMGRWLSPDWSAKEEPVPYAKLDDPQTLNLYAYVGNNPLGRADDDGHGWIDPRPLMQFAHDVTVGALKGFGRIAFSALSMTDSRITNPAYAHMQDMPAALNYSNTTQAVAGTVAPLVLPAFGGAVSVTATVSTIETESATVSAFLPETVARAIPASIDATTLAASGASDAFVTSGGALNGMTSSQISNALTIPESPSGFNIFEFPTPDGIASPINRTNPGFVGGG
jgi:RHS repeat-associated protein